MRICRWMLKKRGLMTSKAFFLELVVLVGFGLGGSLRGQSGGFAYVANEFSNNVSAYTINGATGVLREVGTFGAGSQPSSVTVDPTGHFVYVAFCNTPCGSIQGGVSAYTINGGTGALTPVAGSPFPAGSGSLSVTVDPTGQFAYVANANSSNVSAFAIKRKGGLWQLCSSPFPARMFPNSITTTAGPPPPAP